MKKYDIALLSLYIILIASAYGVNRYVYYKDLNLRKAFQEIVETQDIESIVIDNVDSNLEIFYTQEGDLDNWRIRGGIDQSHLNKIYIEDKVLHIENIGKKTLYKMKINRNIPITITNSPNIKILSDEELAKKKENKKIRHSYEL